jgi:hypothetical protein
MTDEPSNIIPFLDPHAPAQTLMDAIDDVIAERSSGLTLVTVVGILPGDCGGGFGHS